MKTLEVILLPCKHQSGVLLTHNHEGEALVLKQKPQLLETLCIVFQHCLAKRAQKRGSQLLPADKALDDRLDPIGQ